MQRRALMTSSQDHPIGRRRGAAIARVVLGVVLAFGALNAFGGALYGLGGAEGVPREWLDGSPFSDYVVPSLFLGIVVGGAFAIASIAVAARRASARTLALAAGAIVLAWLAAQLAIIGYVSWMQPVTAATGLLILVLAWTMHDVRTGGHARTR
jgi:hypothetical protein